ncbi:Protein PTHB1 [Hypsibius exemplaris]|uniref:Protein PTHB1 n=1 Tax=Hypsibius exemplaris TaxID=2072580 RepID=A0A1W0W8G3_HYPEX|nr:Protein PTHB1 [Hypsibius exemplaris]
MSVWKARDFWEAPLGQETGTVTAISGLPESSQSIQCSRGCLNLVRQSERTIADIIIAGTWSGILRGYYPEQANYVHEHFLFEKQLDGPILQIENGNFILGSTTLGAFQLAVLHPDRITICYYAVNKSSDDTTGLAVLRTYKLKASAYSMVTGMFGGIKGRQMICVATLDGRFTIIDQETVIETPVLEDFLLPGPLCYLPDRDSFLLGSSSWTADCYSYSEMASKAGLISSKPDQQTRMRKAWTYNCGECLVDIKAGSEREKNPVLLLGERHLFWLDLNGIMRSIRRLDCSPSFLTLYPSGKDGSFSFIMGTTMQTIFVFEEMIPKWTSRLPAPVVDVRVAKVAGAEGMLVALAEDGHVSAYYLGTDPEVYETKATATTRKFNEDEIKIETNRLAEMIRQSEAAVASGVVAVEQGNEPSAVTVTVGAFSDISFAFDPRQQAASQRTPISKTQVTVESKVGILSDVQIDVQLSDPFVCVLTHSVIDELDRAVAIGLTVQNTLQAGPQQLSGVVIVRFMREGVNRIQKETFSLPFGLVAQPTALAKKAQLKLDFDISPNSIRLADFFPDLGPQADGLGLSVDFYGVGIATILVSKKQETKIRIQSDDPSLLVLVCREFQRRMAFLAPGNTLVCASNFLNEEFEAILQQKVEASKAYDTLKADLTLWTTQLFVVEKRFLARLKDRDISIVNKLEELLEATQEKIIEVVEQCERTQRTVERVRARMAAMLALMNWLVALNNRTLTADEARTLELVVNGSLEEVVDESWESRSAQSANLCLTAVYGELPENYTSLPGAVKQEILWSQISANPYPPGHAPTASPSPLNMSKIVDPDYLAISFTWTADEMPRNRVRIIHTYAGICKVDVKIFPNSTYSGVFKTGGPGILRMSLANRGPSLPPGLALKILIDGRDSQNFQLLNSREGQGKNMNFFAKPMRNIFLAPSKLGPVEKAFRASLEVLPGTLADRPESITNMPLYEQASVGSDGVNASTIVAPYLVTLTPNPAVGWDADDQTDFRTKLAAIPEGSLLYTVSVKRSLDEDDAVIGEVVSRSAIIASSYGDETIFFNHAKKAWQPLTITSIFGELPENYISLPGKAKQEILWAHASAKPYPIGQAPTTSPSALNMTKLMNPDYLAVSFTWMGDEMPRRRIRVVHTFGSVCKVDLLIFPNSTYTGVFKTGGPGILRLSIANPTYLAKGGPSFPPSLGLKILIDGQTSQNFILIHGGGQGKNMNFFAKPMRNLFLGPSKLAGTQLANQNCLDILPGTLADRPESITNMPLYEQASVGSDGVNASTIVAPYLVTLTPNPAVGWDADEQTDFRTKLAAIPEGSLLYTVSVKRSLDEDDAVIGEVVSRSAILASSYGDETIFFNHAKKAWQP